MLSAIQNVQEIHLLHLGRLTKCSEVADNFTNKFEIQSVEIIANAQGVLDVEIGHPSKTSQISKKFEPASSIETQQTGALVVSTGKSQATKLSHRHCIQYGLHTRR